MNYIARCFDRAYTYVCASCFEKCGFIYENIILSTTFWCKALSHFDCFRNEDCWLRRILNPVCSSCITHKQLCMTILTSPSEYTGITYAQVKVFDALKLLSKPCVQREASNEPPVHSIYESLYLDIMSLLFFANHFYIFHLFIYSYFKWFSIVAHCSVIWVVSVCSWLCFF